MNKPIFTISLDFELLWGIFDKVGDSYKPGYFTNTRKVIPEMLDSFAAAGIQATWATVGMLFAENEQEWLEYSPTYLPSYHNKKYSAYEWVKTHGILPQVHFAPELIRQIIHTPGQELGSHSFAHYYTLMRGQTPEQFREDLKATQRIAYEKFGVNLKSLVFPRNHLNELYLEICLEEGYRFVRGNPKDWFWQETQHEGFSKKLFRSADCFIRVSKRTSYPYGEIKVIPGEPMIIPASRILRPRTPRSPLMNKIRLHRILTEMSVAASSGEIYHLWWHPHNFGTNPAESMRELKKIISHFLHLKKVYGMESLNMEGIGNLVNSLVQTKNQRFPHR